MKTEKERIINSALIAEDNINGVIYRLYENRIYHIVIPPMHNVGMEIVEYGLKFIQRNGGGKFYNIFEFSNFSDIKPEMREWAADPKGNDYTFSDAIVIHSLSQKILADFYIRFNKPVKPTKVFFNLKSAEKWTLKQMEE